MSIDLKAMREAMQQLEDVLPEESLAEFKARAAAAWERDMQPVCSALVSALQGGSLEELKGFQALIPGLLRRVNKDPALADLLALQLGETFLQAVSRRDAETQREAGE